MSKAKNLINTIIFTFFFFAYLLLTLFLGLIVSEYIFDLNDWDRFLIMHSAPSLPADLLYFGAWLIGTYLLIKQIRKFKKPTS